MSDHGCQPMSAAFMKGCATFGISELFTNDNNPNGNADMDRGMWMLREHSSKRCL